MESCSILQLSQTVAELSSCWSLLTLVFDALPDDLEETMGDWDLVNI